jgi:hypothetical protein
VHHPRFGTGDVESLTGFGDQLKVVVRFPRYGRKTFRADQAPLTKV